MVDFANGGPVAKRTLRGRDAESRTLDRLLAVARSGHSGVLVIRGAPGIGKSALLDYLAENSPGFQVVRTAGVEPEMELPFAGLHQLCSSLLGHIERLPAPQRDALRVAFGIQAGDPPDRFLVSVAALQLLSHAAERRPLACLIDDAQWLDRASIQALAFTARRLLAERVVVVFTVREAGHPELAGLPELALGGLGDSDAHLLLASAIQGRLDPQVRDRIVAEAQGNPLALLELPLTQTPAQLAGGFGLPDARPLRSLIEESFLARARALPPDTQRLLLIAAAEPVGDTALLWRAARMLKIDPDAAAQAVDAGLIELGSRVRFRHPLVRSALYQAAGIADRREVHHALAMATDPKADPDRRAWHRAHATLGPDEAVADELEHCAQRAQARGGVAAAAAFLERAAELTADPDRRGTRALAAAQATFDAGAPERAAEIVAAAELGLHDELQRAQAERLRAQLAFSRNRGAEAVPLLLRAARRLSQLDTGLARETYLEALGAAVFSGRAGGDRGLHEVAEAARAAPGPGRPARGVDILLDALTARFITGYRASVVPLREALRAFWDEGGPEFSGGNSRWRFLWLVCPVTPEPLAPDLWDDIAWDDMASAAVQMARDVGALAVLPVALSYLACVHLHKGEFAAASALVEESEAISAATGIAPLRYTTLLLHAWRGQELAALTAIEAEAREAVARGEGRAVGLADHATAVLHNGLGNYDAALAAAKRACEYDDLAFFGWSLAEQIEAAARLGAAQDATEQLGMLAERARASGTDWALGIEARSRALLCEGAAADTLYQEAIARLGRSRMVVHRARAHLVYGEWLRRTNRRREAREHLGTAYEMFGGMGAAGFAGRARRELGATGGEIRKRSAGPLEKLTPQESQIAQLARDGHTNAEIAVQLFISPRTVEWHLRGVFAKLGITSRRELRRTLPG